MATDIDPPIDRQTAYQQAKDYLETSESNPSNHDPLLAASVCVQSSAAKHQAAGGALAAELADQSGSKIESILYELPAALDAQRPKTRVHTMATVEHISHLLPTTAVDVVDCIIPRTSDPNPLVREAACSALAAILNGYMWEGEDEELPEQTREEFQRAIEPLFMQIRDNFEDERFKWTTSFAVDHPRDTLWGRVEEGESRRPYIRWQATYAISLLAHWFPNRIAEHSQHLTALPFEAAKPETRGYAVDALGRADATETLQDIRNRACQMLHHERTKDDGLTILHSFTIESPNHLVDAATAVSSNLDTLTGRQRRLATEIVMHAAVFDPSAIIGTVREIVEIWLSANDEKATDASSYSVELLGAIAANHPDLVLPSATRAVGLNTTVIDSSQEAASKDDRTMQWDTERAWDTLIETAKEAPDTVLAAIDRAELQSNLSSDTTDSRQAKQLYAHIVPMPPPKKTFECLFDQLLSDEPGAASALRTLATRDPVTVAQTASAILEGYDAPPHRVLRFLEHISSKTPAELEPLLATLWSWNNTIQPTDERWPALVTTIGRIAVAIEDGETISKMLHLDDPMYCQRFLQTKVAPEVIQAAPNQAIPPLIEHLSHENSDLPRMIVRMFASTHGDYGGWSSTIRDALSEKLHNPDWRIRAYAVRALGRWSDSTVQTAIEELLTTETNSDVRFEAHRVLRQTGGD